MNRSLSAMIAGGVCAALVAMSAATADASAAAQSPVKHVLLLSVDGLHQSDLALYVAAHPRSALANLVRSISRPSGYARLDLSRSSILFHPRQEHTDSDRRLP